jgi:hypothetical protein
MSNCSAQRTGQTVELHWSNCSNCREPTVPGSVQYFSTSFTVEVGVKLWPTVSQPMCLGVGLPFGTYDQIFLFCLIIVGFLMLSTLSDKKMRLSFTRTICCRSRVQVPQNSRPYFTVSFEAPPTWRARSPYLYSPGTGWPSYTSRHWVPFVASYDSQGYGGGILTRLHTGKLLHWSWNHVTTDGQSVCLGVKPTPGLPVGRLLSCFCGAPSLTRGRVCSLQCNH